MHHFFVDPDKISSDEISITGSDVNHIRNVLRIHTGEQISISSGQVTYRCEVAEITPEHVTAKIMWSQESDTELPVSICLFQGLPKSNKMEFIIQKAVELGACGIVPMSTGRTVVRLDADKAESKRRHWAAISENAAKQSMRSIVPEIKPVMTFQEAVEYARSFDRKFIPYERAGGIDLTRDAFRRIVPGESVAIFIGPEGGFEKQEVEKAGQVGIIPVTLGRRILRTETAGLAVLSVLMFMLER